MPPHHWLAFAAASALLLLLPGPTVLMIVSHALAHGRKAAAATVAGVVLGDFAAMTVSLAGLGALLAAINAGFYALAASAARRAISRPRVQRGVNRAGGTLLIGAGVLASGLR